MQNFDLFLKTKIYFGKGKEDEIGHILSEYGFKKILIIIGQGSARTTGLLDRIIDHLNEEGIKFQVIEGVRPNPTIEAVRQGVAFAKAYKPDCLLAVGGGSVIDTAKSIACNYYYDDDCFNFNLHIDKPTKALPVGVILTIAAAGSECSNSCVLQDDSLNTKAGFNSELVRPLFAIENPELTYSVSKRQTANGIIDILMHTLERYFCESQGYEFADYIAEALIRSVIDAGYKVFENFTDYEARSTLMLASSFSHNGLTGVGKPFMMPAHQLEHALSGRYPEVSHGEGLAILFPAWAKYYLPYDVDKFNNLAKHVFGIDGPNKEENGRLAIQKLEDFFSYLGSATYLEDLNLPDLDIYQLADLVTRNGTKEIPHHKKPMNRDVVVSIFKIAKERA